MKQEKFYSTLPEVPPVPDSIYPAVEKEVRRHRAIQKTVWALAACLILAIGITGYYPFQNKEQPIASSQELPEEIIDDLQILNDFVNGNSLDEEIAMYAVVDMNIF